SDEVVRRIRFIRRARYLGFTLAEIQELLELRQEPGLSCADVKQRTQAKIAAIDARVKGLEEMRNALAQFERLGELCPGESELGACPILEMLADVDPPS